VQLNDAHRMKLGGCTWTVNSAPGIVFTPFSSDCMVYLHLSSPPPTICYIDEQHDHTPNLGCGGTELNDDSNNLNGSNMNDMWGMK